MEKPTKKQMLRKLGIDPEKLKEEVEQTSQAYRAYVQQPQQASPELRRSIQQVREDYTRARPLQVQIDSIRPSPPHGDSKEHYALDMSIDADEVVSTPRLDRLMLNDVPLEVESVSQNVAHGRHGMRWKLRVAAAVSDEQDTHFDATRDQRVSGTLKGGRPFDGCYRGALSRSS